ncbi:TerB family tellurite resistance protein [Mesorhizobium sp. Z1-4]|uniref:tellurite resistance TerB family protein n=1 Tax=Mesorhizobium sp. Z1-4 TaxID=2448478 RepID=UPI000FD990D5|nr:TerB family tellurite resistance protein [Mesorhizobium sp. Z1-4]
MFDRFREFLNQLPGVGENGDIAEGDPRVAAAALLTHVMDADGERTDDERDMLKRLLGDVYGLEGSELATVIKAGEAADREAVDLYAFTSVLDRHLDREGKFEFVGLMWDMVFSDGALHEVEDNLVWRVAELIHVERDQRIALRQAAQVRAGMAAD